MRSCPRLTAPAPSVVADGGRRLLVTQLVHWYNHEHRHSAIGFVTPGQRHAESDRSMLLERAKVYEAARLRHPHRWSRSTRNWTRSAEVHLNPEKEKTPHALITQKAA